MSDRFKDPVEEATGIVCRGLKEQLDDTAFQRGLSPHLYKDFAVGYLWGYCRAVVEEVGSDEPGFDAESHPFDSQTEPVFVRSLRRSFGEIMGERVIGNVSDGAKMLLADPADGDTEYHRGRAAGLEDGRRWGWLAHNNPGSRESGVKLAHFIFDSI